MTQDTLTQVAELEAALSEFLNGASDEYLPSEWRAETKRNFDRLRKAYGAVDFAAISALGEVKPEPVALEWRDGIYLYFNDICIGNVSYADWRSPAYWVYALGSSRNNGGFETIEVARTALETAAREWLSPTLAAPAGWKDISTAPKDGTEIIGYRPDQGVFVFRWAAMEEFVPRDQNGDPTEEYDDRFACWWHDRWDWMEGELTPTHWMPLPASPQVGG